MTNKEQTILTDEPIGFDRAEMRPCRSCGRANGPDRMNCLYCGSEFELATTDAERVRVISRELESWEKGYNVVIASAPRESQTALNDIARRASIETELLEAVSTAGKALPVGRYETATQAEAARSLLEGAGYQAIVVADELLAADKPPVRCRSARIDDLKFVFTAFSSGESIVFARDGVALLVGGAFYESKLETTEKRKGGKSWLLTETPTQADMAVLDIYSLDDAVGVRIQGVGFDFSVLGDAKQITAAQNSSLLKNKILQHAPNAVLDDGYEGSRRMLDLVWEPERRKDSLGMQRTGFGRKDLAAVVTTNNAMQFTKYSRLRRHLL